MEPMAAVLHIPYASPPVLRQPAAYSPDFRDFLRRCLKIVPLTPIYLLFSSLFLLFFFFLLLTLRTPPSDPPPASC